jgi:hypothetical protein
MPGYVAKYGDRAGQHTALDSARTASATPFELSFLNAPLLKNCRYF